MPRPDLRPLPFLLLVASLAAQAPKDVVDKIIKEAREHSQVMPILEHLTNSIGPRLTGSQRLIQACEWARDQFKSFGIESARTEQWGEVEVGFDRGVHSGAMFAVDAQGQLAETKLTFGTNAWTAGTDGAKRGPAVLAPGKDDLAAARDSLKGAWIVSKGAASKDLKSLAEEVGALGFVQRNGGWTGKGLILTDGNMGTKWEKWAKLPVISVLEEQFDDLSKRVKEGAKVELVFDIQNRFKQGPVPLYNVLAEIKGTQHPNELVIVGGHIDSWDGATGTTDNGTGTATTIEAARLLMKAGAKPKRTIRFMLWSGEEQGLLGSRAYIKAHPEENDRVSAVLVHDGGTNYVSGIYGLDTMIPHFEKVFAPVLELDKEMPFKIRTVKNLPGFIGSDQDSYVAKGVPGFFWDQKGRANYNHTHHTQHDTFDAAIAEYQTHTSIVVAIGALGIANLPAMLPRKKELAGQPNPAAQPRRLGVQLDEENMTISEVNDGSAADKAGLQVGDKLLEIDGHAIKERADLANGLNEKGEQKQITVLRGGKKVSVLVTFPKLDPKKSGG